MNESAPVNELDFGDYDWIVLDVTGTLLIPHPSPVEIYCQAAADCGVNIPLDALTERVRGAICWNFQRGRSESEPLRRAETSELIERERWRSIVGESLQELTREDHDRAYERLWHHFSLPTSWRWNLPAKRFVEHCLQHSVPLAIATNFDSRVHALLDGHPPLDQIKRRFLSSELGYSKPNRRFYDAVSEQLQVPRKRILMVGDDAINDLQGSRAAGWQAIHIRDIAAQPRFGNAKNF